MGTEMGGRLNGDWDGGQAEGIGKFRRGEDNRPLDPNESHQTQIDPTRSQQLPPDPIKRCQIPPDPTRSHQT